jgi:hypothetical protein
MMFRKFMLLTVVVLVVFQLGVASAFTSRCKTAGKGYGSKSQEAIRTILDLRVSPVPGDDVRLQEMLNKWLSDKHVFVPKAGIEVAISYGVVTPESPIMIKPVGSEQTFYITSEGLENCR